MGLGPLGGLLLEAFEPGVELVLVDPPEAAAPDLDGGELAGADQGVDLGGADVEVGGEVVEGEVTRLDVSLGGFRGTE